MVSRGGGGGGYWEYVNVSRGGEFEGRIYVSWGSWGVCVLLYVPGIGRGAEKERKLHKKYVLGAGGVY